MFGLMLGAVGVVAALLIVLRFAATLGTALDGAAPWLRRVVAALLDGEAWLVAMGIMLCGVTWGV